VHGSPWIDGAGRIVLGGEAGGIAILSTTDAEPRFLRGHTGPVRSVELSVDATEVLSAGWDGTVRLWTVADGKARTVLRHEGTTNAAGLLDGGAAVVSIGEDRRVQLWRRADDESEDLFAAQGAVVRLAIAHDGHAFAVSSRAGEVTAWTSSDATARSLPGHMATVMALAISPAGDLVASGGEDKVVRLSRVGDGGAVCRAEVGAAALSVAFAPDGRTVFAGLSDGRVLRLDAGCKATTVLRADGEVLTVLVRDHLLLVGSSGGDICLIETESGATVTLRGEARLISLAAGPKGTPIVSAHLVPGEGSSMRFWRPGLLPTPTTRRDFAAWLTGLTDFDGGTDLLPDSATGPASSSH
jgi:WD40 repeat protein